MSGQQQTEQMKECIEYFRQNIVWEKVLKGFREKYFSYGKFSGTVVLKNLQMQEIEELEGFFGRSFHGQKSVSVSAIKFKETLENSRYGKITPEELLENYFQKPLLGRQEEKLQTEQAKQKMIERISREFSGTPAQSQIEYFQSMLRGTAKNDITELEEQLKLSARIFNSLPYRQDKKVYLAVFAAMLTGNPHAFDQGMPGGKLLCQIVQRDLELRGRTVCETSVFPAYKRQKSYLAAGILLDDVSNYVMLCNVQAVKKDGNYHKGTAGFFEERDMVQIPLGILAEWDQVRCPQQKMYIMENPAVFAILCDKINSGQTDRRYACMCMNGQPRLSGLMMLDLLAKSETTVYYGGDLDPEGILIAQKLAAYYQGEFHFWHMDVEDYEKCKSEEVISSRRMKILDKITDERLLPVVKQIKREKVAGYQERLYV